MSDAYGAITQKFLRATHCLYAFMFLNLLKCVLVFLPNNLNCWEKYAAGEVTIFEA